MVPNVQFRILGPLEVRVAGHPARITAPREQATLAALLLEAGRVVSVDRLVDAVWASRPPTGPANQVAICISSLRRKLVASGAPGDLIVTSPPGYLLRTKGSLFDATQVETHFTEARRLIADDRIEGAAAELRSALDLWRGPVLAGVNNRYLQPGIVFWDERRLAIAEQYAQLELDLGHSYEIIGDLSATVAAQPLRERPRALLMTALHQVGRKAEALDVYADFRRTLRGELGLEPGEELRAVQEAILQGTLSVGPLSPGRPWGRPPRSLPVHGADGGGRGGGTSAHADRRYPVPAMLPADIADFTGRVAETDTLVQALTSQQGTAVPVAVVCGPGGVGKTALAVHTAHRLAKVFPDGQLYADLRGVRRPPVRSGELLARFLGVLGVSRRQLPELPEERVAMYRSLLAGRQVLVVLDDADSQEQLEALMPGSPTCGVLITSRTRLTGPAGASALELENFGPDRAMALLRAILGGERVDAEPGAARELARQCDYLPLALRITGARLAAKPHWTLAGFSDQLADEHRRLDELAIGSLGVRANLTHSYRQLSPLPRKLFHRLGQLTVADFSAPLGAALLGTDERDAAEALEALVDAQLLAVTRSGPVGKLQYRFRDLVRLYAREKAGIREGTTDQRAGVARPSRHGRPRTGPADTVPNPL